MSPTFSEYKFSPHTIFYFPELCTFLVPSQDLQESFPLLPIARGLTLESIASSHLPLPLHLLNNPWQKTVSVPFLRFFRFTVLLCIKCQSSHRHTRSNSSLLRPEKGSYGVIATYTLGLFLLTNPQSKLRPVILHKHLKMKFCAAAVLSTILATINIVPVASDPAVKL